MGIAEGRSKEKKILDLNSPIVGLFFVKLFDAKLEFLKTGDKVDRLVLHQNGTQSTAKRIE